MKREKISGGFAVVGYPLLLLFFVPLCLFLLYVITKNLRFEGVIFLLAFLVPSVLVVGHAYTYADLNLEGNNILVKKLFRVEVKSIAEYKTVEQEIMPLKYCIKFQDGSKAWFALKTSSIFRHITSTDPDRVLKELRLKFQELKLEYSIEE